MDRKSTSGTFHFLGNYIIYWHGKKTNVVLSTTKAEYFVSASFCVQIIWMEQHLSYYGNNLEIVLIKCDNTSAIKRTKIISHFTLRLKTLISGTILLRIMFKKEDCLIEFVNSSNKLADIFTKLFPRENLFL